MPEPTLVHAFSGDPWGPCSRCGHPAYHAIHRVPDRPASDLLGELEAALNDATDVAIWLSALVGNPDGANDPDAAKTWQEQMRPRLFGALAALADLRKEPGGGA